MPETPPSHILSVRPPSPRGITLEHLWLGLPFFVIVYKGFLFPLPLLDFWWHLKMGEIITTTHSIPRTDLFSFTAAGKPFIVQNWLSEVIYYAVYRLGGFPLLIFLNTLLLAAALLPIFLLCRESTSRTRLAVLAAFLASFAYLCNMRPQVFSFVMFALFYWILDGYRFRRRDKLWLLPLLMILWVNLHGAFGLGLGLTALYIGSEGVRRLIEPDRADALSFGELRKLGLALAVCAAATLINPEHYRLYDYVRVVMTDQASQLFVVEWQPPRVDTLEGALLFYGLFFLALLILMYSRKRADLTDVALFFGFSIFALTATRNSIWFTMIVAPIVARYLPEVDYSRLSALRRCSLIEMITRRREGGGAQRGPFYRLNLMIAFVLLLIIVVVSPWVRPSLYHVSLLEPATPVKAMDYIESHALEGNIFHPQAFGDYLIWRLHPLQRSFFDGRVHLFGEQFIRDFQILFVDSCWQEKLTPYKIRYLLLSKDPRQTDSALMIESARKSRDWAVLFEDGVAVLFERRVAANAEGTGDGHVNTVGAS